MARRTIPSSSMNPMFHDSQVRSVFISDAHLGFRYSKSDELLSFLNTYHPEYLYLVGDFLDGWRLKANWYWPDVYSKIIDRILNMVSGGTKVFYTPGNHDDFLRGPIPAVYPIEIADQFIHTTVDGQKFCVTHGDLFDTVENNSKWLSGFGTSIYDFIMWSNKRSNRLLKRCQIREINYAYGLKRLSKRTVNLLSRNKSKLVRHAKQADCIGVICGHNHFPAITRKRGVIYANTGDWVEHTSALVELNDGTMVLLDQGKIIDRIDSILNQAVSVRRRSFRKRKQPVISAKE